VRPLYTIPELAQALRLQPGTIRNKLSRGEDMPRSIQVGRRRLFPENEVETWLRSHAARSAVASRSDQIPKRVGRRRSPDAAVPSPVPWCRKLRSNERTEQLPMQQIGLFGEESE
jgi:excisionase family DNA binding protein